MWFNQNSGPAMPFIHEDFLLGTRTARRLYHEYAEAEPILDYHCHLPPQDVAETASSATCSRSGWRATITNGAPCGPTAWTSDSAPGDAAPYEKFLAWARDRAAHAAQSAVPLDAPGAEALFRHRRAAGRAERAAHLGAGQRRSWPATTCARTASCSKFQVKAVCTTDDPTDDLACHQGDRGLGTGDQGLSRASAPTRR